MPTNEERDAAPERELVSARDFAAPREQVFGAWVDPERLARWWGPNGFTNTFEEFDPRPGGQWRFVMHGPDGVQYPNHSTFLEVVPPERIVFDHLTAPRFRVTATFVEVAGRTRLRWRMRFESTEELERVKRYAVEGNQQNLDKLEALLKSERP